ncbi:U3 small nuclear ribonucleoprotein (snRNP), putative [Trypanosoma equiperdum]|uniref:U3 small nuclear ribonucleoprotein (SnRNP), putative n=4 Tax=Trypanozoon TaxID=39700 RepID=Q583Q6_TRYB2|nr:U3 small nuclear ribonucleoprotein (snRNP),putative [Trypanosoma brucei gambiense DAL972]XP_845399.1 U3 small nuclear ribonucleoprotein (snRNP), putative [Trypanosoma brucei brucei TREU927]AAX80981.1 U3 small nuclear ribonucleoprotein (snRNP), putative [Trypanosoma brucei]RHW71774.1 U3 small nuclear ribonucleoprotein (snRNP) [Trypanosoma brucei equiperdum]SCU67687.1 U3 small nuclear ribonucleoprotein (snRNP), putative [Trypanosoma equiperdum]AAZ11840.1 U3 small nuclear ribonucleoprotein (sn|eukprot:XP_011774062.1 U3 small nuclear ribonucleoprotein (snRNP),putative [Trypanosoma brucei gambiense DAL972]
MRRSVIRQRKEFLERRQNEHVHAAIYTKKEQFRDAIQNATPLPGHLRKDALALKKFSELDDDQTKVLQTTVDDEYAKAGVEDPHVLVTTSREPSQKLLEFAKEVRLIIPNAVRLNRGNLNIRQLMEAARRDQYSDVVVLQESQGVPDSLTISHLPLGPTVVFTIHNLVTRHDIEDVGTMSEQYPHLIFENFTTKLGCRIRDVLKYLFPVPKPEATRVLTFDNQNDFISFRHHTFKMVKKSNVQLTEVGPRMELSPCRIMLGTLEMDDAETEWVLQPYMNTAKKRRLM